MPSILQAPVAIDPLEPLPFAEAIDWFTRQAPWISGSSWAYMEALAAQKGDEISSAAVLSVLDDTWGELDRSVRDGLPYSDFVRNLAERLEQQWWTVDSPRMRLIHQNNVGSALMAGRFAQMEDPDVLADRPVWVFDAIADFRTSEICEQRNGVTLPASDAWWLANRPLLHHHCRSSIIAIPLDEVEDFGGYTPQSAIAALDPAAEGWGAPASWETWKPKPEDYHAPLADEYARWKNGQPYLSAKKDWDAKWHALLEPLLPAVTEPAAPVVDLDPLTDPAATVTWGKDAVHEGALLHGVPLSQSAAPVWKEIPDVAMAEPPMPGGKVSTGVVVVEPDGRIWIVEPTGHFGGYKRTFPKGGLSAGLTGQQNALKELWEESGLVGEVTGFVGDFAGTTGTSRYYIAKRIGGAPWKSGVESSSVQLATQQDAAALLNTVRDQEILAVLQARLSGAPLPDGLKTYVAPKPAPLPQKVIAAQPGAEGWAYGLDPSLYTYSAAKLGGSTPGVIVEHPDAPGKRFLLKQLSDRIKADAETSGSELYALASNDIVKALPLAGATLPSSLKGSGRYFTLQEMAADVKPLTSIIGPKGNPDWTKLTPDQQAQILAHGIAAWQTGEHDGHADQYLVDKTGRIIRIDFGQALKYTVTTGDKLHLNYHPNAVYGEAAPAHLLLLSAIQKGTVPADVLHHPAVKAAATRVSKLTGAKLEAAVAAYGANRPGGKSAADIRKILLARAKSAKADWAKLFGEVQGHEFTWKGTRKPRQPKVVEPPQGEQRRRAPEIVEGVDLHVIAPTLRTHGAVTVAADGGLLRSQAWRVQGERAGTTDVTAFRGELDESVWSNVKAAMLASGAQAGRWESAIRDGRPRPVLTSAGGTSTFLGSAVVLRGAGFKVTFADATAPKAQQGQVKIDVFETDPAKARKIFEQAVKAIGLGGAGMERAPSPEEAEKARLTRALWNLEGGKFRAPLTAAQARSQLARHGVNPDDVVVTQNDLGYNEPRIPGRAEAYRKQGVKLLYHQMSPDATGLRGVAGTDGGKGGLLSTVARTENGIVRSGMSSAADLASGGASSVFTRLVGTGGEAASSWYSSSRWTAVLSPKLLDRADWYAYPADNYGSTDDSSGRPYRYSQRNGADEIVKQVASRGSSSNEFMFRNAVAREDILFFAVTSESERKKILAALKVDGVRTIRGQPVEQMVVVMNTPTDFSRLRPENPVHAYIMGRATDYPAWTETYGEAP